MMEQQRHEQTGALGQPVRVSKMLPVGNSGPVSVRDHESDRWDAVLRRDRRVDGTFVYAVTSTGVYCRPSCGSRRPRRERARFFDTPAGAEQAGFRPCLRCRPERDAAPVSLGDAIQRASRYLASHAETAVSLKALAAIAGLSPTHLQRQFKRALGLSPREYQAACRADRFRRELRAGRDVTTAIYEAGYGSPSRIYESSPTGRGMNPGTYRRGGVGADVGYTTVHCALGFLLVAATSKGVCAVKLGDTVDTLEADLRREFPAATLARDVIVRRTWIRNIVARLTKNREGEDDLPLDIRGTAFQWRVWRALQAIPAGETRSYVEVAKAIGRPTAVRAVARACATNPACLIIPCHRVVGKDGKMTGYRWGVERKRRLLADESERARQRSTPRKAK
jgi:AraC family transcriptional regulator of adaptative response/methylated-DNA-[protein]-cysteine methyltransferase